MFLLVSNIGQTVSEAFHLELLAVGPLWSCNFSEQYFGLYCSELCYSDVVLCFEILTHIIPWRASESRKNRERLGKGPRSKKDGPRKTKILLGIE